ncbi:bombesin receptor-activated protein C6orf89 homolog isoform X1 [Tympanuchus pallidicinctus]|uniref:bombesin receptor-activated protein C6orf89 homolog isoform X1 n=2 Tax=Tympanuchus pallidicinctus TaxID=109042 RepID=UPI00228747FC|nr:bombesin receptor-activated protein C6orf89 homolog isoform X1 [Tympanuchus pallidicinctus]
MDFSLEAMELSANELSIYDKLSETIDLVRQTGHQCGMSEKAIEKFIKQLLERNEPQRGPPRYPVLVAIYKGLLTLGLVLLTVYFVIQPYSPLPPETPLSRAHAWGSLIGHIRLLSLPIAKKYMLEKCQDWWAAGCRQNTSALPANCTACSTVKSLQIVTDIGELSEKLQRSQPFLTKTGQSLSYEELKHFQSQDPELAEIIIEENSPELWSCLPRQSFPFFLPWNRSVNRTQILQEFFPTSSLLSFPKTVSLENCFLIRHPDLGNKSYSLHSLFVVGSGQLTLTVVPLDKCRGHCEMFKVDLEAGDLGYASTDYWTMSFVAKGTEPAVVCYGAAS